MVHCGSAFELGASGLPYHCAPLVCVPDVIAVLAVWRQNNQTKKSLVLHTTRISWFSLGEVSGVAALQTNKQTHKCVFNDLGVLPVYRLSLKKHNKNTHLICNDCATFQDCNLSGGIQHPSLSQEVLKTFKFKSNNLTTKHHSA